ncbi:MAG: glutamate synthase subunit alpha, partial [Methylophilaceae bacterium]
MTFERKPSKQGLYDPKNEHDSCGVGFVANIHGKKSHQIVKQGLEILTNLTHRGATGYDPKLGDGAGLLMQMPHAFMQGEAKKLNIDLPDEGHYAVGMLFLPQATKARKACEAIITKIIQEEAQIELGWRDVPVDNADIAQAAKDVEPVIRQVIIGRNDDLETQNAFERKLFVIRKRIENTIAALELDDPAKFYVSSMSSRTIVYKGMLLACEVGIYFKD